MKLNLKELKKVIEKADKDQAVTIDISIQDNYFRAEFKYSDLSGDDITITLSDEKQGNSFPKITRTSRLVF